jgi:hypothetical protein
MPVPNAQPIAALVAGSLLLASVAWWAFSAPQIDDPGRPTWDGANINSLVASVPKIDHFKHFYTNDDNPFVPFNLRGPERAARDPKPQKLSKPPPVITINKPRPPVTVVEQPREPLVLPKVSPMTAEAPIVFGFVASSNDQTLLVRMPGSEESIRLAPGNQINQWTLVAIESSSIAIFLDPRGVEHRCTIAEGVLAVTPTDNSAASVKDSGKNPKNDVREKMRPHEPASENPRVPRPIPLPQGHPTPEPKKPKER